MILDKKRKRFEDYIKGIKNIETSFQSIYGT